MSNETFIDSLRSRLSGDVRNDAGSLAAYSGDASNHRVVPIAIASPRDEDDVSALVLHCREAQIPITARGAGTNIAGNSIGRGVIADFSRYMTNIVNVNHEDRTAEVQPGVVLDDLRRRSAEKGLTFGVDPSTHSRCTLGGMIGTNACGSHSVAWGTTVDNIQSLSVILSDGSSATLGWNPSELNDGLSRSLKRVGERYRIDIERELGRFPRQVSGFALQYLLSDDPSGPAKSFVGSEGTCGLVTQARVKLIDLPPERQLVVAGFPDILAASRAATNLAQFGPLTVEGMDSQLVALFDQSLGPQSRPQLPNGEAWLLLEVSGDDKDHAHSRANALATLSRDCGAIATHISQEPASQASFWNLRERAAGLVTRSPDGREFWPGWEDSAVPPMNLHDYIRDLRQLLDHYGRSGILYGHFGEGCVHIRIDHDLLSETGLQRYRSFQEDAADLVVAHQGSLSGEHGDGRARSELLTRMYGPEVMNAFQAFKSTLDPTGLFNPGIIVNPVPLDSDMKYVVAEPIKVKLRFKLENDEGNLSKALRRCVGVGACRKNEGGAMCPSFRATRDERHSTRGRARILSEMLQGTLSDSGWRSKDVRDALDLCLSCKSCRSECPVSVDMATYKAEFLHHHYRWRLRPVSHYSMGWLPLWLKIVRPGARISNWLLDHAAIESLAKRLAGVAQERRIPRTSPVGFRKWFKQHSPTEHGEELLLWVDSFLGGFEPEVLRDAVSVLEKAGYKVDITSNGLCCGLTWVTTGQLGIARRVMRRTVKSLDRDGADLRTIVVLEPSCGAALRTDVPELLGEESSRRVANRVRSFAEVLEGRDLPVNTTEVTEVITQFHCHQRATSGTTADLEILRRLGIAVNNVDEGCCGGAGNFGFETGHYQVSKTCAEQSFLPVMGNHDDAIPVIADGFSCRAQIQQFGERRPVHLAQFIEKLTACNVAQDEQL